MKKELLVLFSMVLSGCIVYLYNQIKNKFIKKQIETVFERFQYLQSLEKNGAIKKEIVHFCNEDEEVECRKIKSNKKNNVHINGKEYTDKTSWFILDKNILWIIGKKEDFIIELHSEIIENF